MNPILICSGVFAVAAIVLGSWPGAVLSLGAAVLYFGQQALDRLHPERKPDPTGAELLQALEAHKVEVSKALENLASKINLGASRRMGMRE